MRNPILVLAAAGLVLAGWVSAAETPAVAIELAHNSGNEQQVKAQLQRLLKEYDLSRWIFTRKIRIEQGTRPHSHPVLTLNTRYATNDRLLLAGFVHEQIHWFLVGKGGDASKAIAEAAQRYSNAPESIADGGAGNAGGGADCRDGTECGQGVSTDSRLQTPDSLTPWPLPLCPRTPRGFPGQSGSLESGCGV